MSKMEREGQEAVAHCASFVMALYNKEFDKVERFLSDEFEVYWPLTREKFITIEDFVAIKQNSEDHGDFRIQNSMYQYDEWDKNFRVSLQVSVYKNGQHPPSAWDILFFDLDRDGTIVMLTEYCMNCCESPPASYVVRTAGDVL